MLSVNIAGGVKVVPVGMAWERGVRGTVEAEGVKAVEGTRWGGVKTIEEIRRGRSRRVMVARSAM